MTTSSWPDAVPRPPRIRAHRAVGTRPSIGRPVLPRAGGLERGLLGSARRRLLGPLGQGVGAFLVYGAASILLFGLPVLRDLHRTYIGVSGPELGTGWTDPQVYMWSLAWWPFAISHHLNPIMSSYLWAPAGANLAWTTSIPGAALLMWPVTVRFGPVVAFNILMLAAPALAATSGYLLCRHVTGRFWPSLVGGWVFGFSAYELAQMTAHLNLSLIFPVPLAVLLVLLRMEGRLRPRAFVPLLALVLVAQFSLSTEVFLSLTVFGFAALGIAAVVAPASRAAILGTVGWIGAAYVATAAVASPYLAAVLRGPHIPVSEWWQGKYSTDLANLVVPTQITRAGGLWAKPASRLFTAGIAEEAGYLGPFLAIVAAFAVGRRAGKVGRVLLWTLALVILLSLGPHLLVEGRHSIPLPWAVAAKVPLLGEALPARFMLYAWLVVGVITALWLAGPARLAWARWAAVAVAVALVLPNVQRPFWAASAKVPTFFTNGVGDLYIRPGDTVLVVPFGSQGWSMLWQAESGMRFRLAGGYGGYAGCHVPPFYQRYGVVDTLLSRRLFPGVGASLRAFVGAVHANVVVLDSRTRGPWRRLLYQLRAPFVWQSGLQVWRFPDSLLDRWAKLRPPNPLARRLAQECA